MDRIPKKLKPAQVRKVLDPKRPGESTGLLRECLERLVIGQEEAIAAVVEGFQQYDAGLNAPGRPIANYLFLGPTGSGKTRVVEATAQALVNNPRAVIKVDCAEFAHGHEIAKIIGCFTPETPILLADGSRKPIQEITVGDSVVTKFGRSRLVTCLHEYWHEGEMVEIRFSSHNQPLTATAGHKILAIKTNKPTGRVRCPKDLYCKDNLEWMTAGELEKNDIVAYPRFKANKEAKELVIDLAKYADRCPRFRSDAKHVWSGSSARINRFITVNEEFARFAGYYVSDGHADKSRKCIGFTLGVPQKSEVLDDLFKLVPKLFGDEIQGAVFNKSENCIRFTVFSRVISLLMADLFGVSTLVKRVPDYFLHLKDSAAWHFIDAALMCDGSVVVRRRVDFSTSSEALYSQLQLILRRLGFTTHSQRHPSVRHGKHGADRYRIYVSGEQIDRFAYQLPLSGNRIKLDNPGNSGIQRESHVDEDFVYFRVRSLEKREYVGPVYDFSVDEDCSYVAENIIVSNSPAGYLGHRETKPLLNQEALNHHHTEEVKLSFLLFDEIEKASDALWNLLLGILDKATLTTGENKKVDFSRCMIFLTSNLGAAEMSKLLSPQLGFGCCVETAKPENDSRLDEKLSKSGTEAARRKFTPEFMNRIDRCVVFKSLGEPELRKILDLELAEVQMRLMHAEKGEFVFSVSPAAKSHLLSVGNDIRYGARHLKRAIERLIVQPLANLISSGQINPGDWIQADLAESGNQLYFYCEQSNLSIESMGAIGREKLGLVA